jgi:hypothetical protein
MVLDESVLEDSMLPPLSTVVSVVKVPFLSRREGSSALLRLSNRRGDPKRGVLFWGHVTFLLGRARRDCFFSAGLGGIVGALTVTFGLKFASACVPPGATSPQVAPMVEPTFAGEASGLPTDVSIEATVVSREPTDERFASRALAGKPSAEWIEPRGFAMEATGFSIVARALRIRAMGLCLGPSELGIGATEDAIRPARSPIDAIESWLEPMGSAVGAMESFLGPRSSAVGPTETSLGLFGSAVGGIERSIGPIGSLLRAMDSSVDARRWSTVRPTPDDPPKAAAAQRSSPLDYPGSS